ncbi:hypothetical protein A3J17_02500 [Candidatus Curtissbacteria bacterium RIFCSPLOWO2_02_FULL_40_11]|nr:MAG: hypothetical protein A3J17_02500 [Candidatus Curtissbacteria bacterium RIFCSPLOWO2_02_FULL_40_11]
MKLLPKAFLLIFVFAASAIFASVLSNKVEASEAFLYPTFKNNGDAGATVYFTVRHGTEGDTNTQDGGLFWSDSVWVPGGSSVQRSRVDSAGYVPQYEITWQPVKSQGYDSRDRNCKDPITTLQFFTYEPITDTYVYDVNIEFACWIPEPAPYSAPSNLSARPGCFSSVPTVDLRWDLGTKTPVTIEVSRNNFANYWSQNVGSASNFTWSYANQIGGAWPTGGDNYQWRINDGQSRVVGPSFVARNCGSITLDTPVPSCPDTNAIIDFSWSSTTGGSRYQIWRDGLYFATANGTVWQYNALASDQGKSHQWYIYDALASIGSSAKLVTTPTCTSSPPSYFINLSVSKFCEGTQSKVTLSWTTNIPPGNNATNMDRSTNGGASYSGNSTGSWTSGSLPYNTTYGWRVRNHDWSQTGGTPVQSNIVNSTTLDCSSSPPPIPPPAPNDSCPAGQQFGSSQSLGGAGNSPPVMENIGDRLIIAVRGTDNGLYIKERRPDGSYRDWYNIGGTTSARPKLAFVSGTLRLYIQGTDGFIYRNSYQSEGSWSGYTNTNTPNSSFGSAGPSAVSTSTLGTFRVSGTNPINLETCITPSPSPLGTITISGDSRCVSGFSRVHLDITVNGLADDRFDIRRSDIGYFTSNNTGTFVWDSSDSNDGTDGSTYGWRVRGRTTGTESNQIFITNRSDCAALPDFQINSFQLREYDGSVCTAAVLTSVSAGDNICFTANVTNVGATYIGNLPNSFHADSAQPACDAPALAPSATNNTMVNLSNGEIKTWNGGPVQVPSTSTNTGTARLHVDYTCAIREIGESEVSPGNWDSADLLTGNHKSVTYSISSTNWLQTFGGDVGAVGQISMSNPPDWQSEYLLIANTIGNASSDKWEVGGYNQPLVPNGGVYNYFNQRFGANARNNTVDCNSAIPQGLSYCGDSTPLVLSSAANLPSTGSAVVFVDGEMTVTGNIDIGSASIVFIARDNIIVSSAVTSADGVYVAGGEFVDCSPCGGTDSQLTINGAVYAQRMFEEGSRSVGALADTTPSLVVNFAPRYLMTMRDLIGTPSIIWREVAP